MLEVATDRCSSPSVFILYIEMASSKRPFRSVPFRSVQLEGPTNVDVRVCNRRMFLSKILLLELLQRFTLAILMDIWAMVGCSS
jgi:hypothetical protein